MKKLMLASLAAALLLAGCKSSDVDVSGLNTAELAYVEWYENMQMDLRENPDYKKLPFKTAKQRDQFNALLRDAYRGKIDRWEFIDRVSTAFPGYEQTVELIAEHLPGQS